MLRNEAINTILPKSKQKWLKQLNSLNNQIRNYILENQLNILLMLRLREYLLIIIW